MTQSLDKAYDWQLFGLQNETATDIKEKMTGYLEENGWAASIAYLGNMAQSEWAVSFEWLRLTIGLERFVEIPHISIFNARMRLSSEENTALLALPQQERKNLYPALFWPAPPVPNDSLNLGDCPATINIVPTEWGSIWIDLGI